MKHYLLILFPLFVFSCQLTSEKSVEQYDLSEFCGDYIIYDSTRVFSIEEFNDTLYLNNGTERTKLKAFGSVKFYIDDVGGGVLEFHLDESEVFGSMTYFNRHGVRIPLTKHEEIILRRETADEYLGQYYSLRDTTFVLTVFNENNKLFGSARDQDTYEIRPLSGDKFSVVHADGGRIEFIRSEDGEIDHFIFTTINNKSYKYPKK